MPTLPKTARSSGLRPAEGPSADPDYERARKQGMALLIFASGLLVAYWALWFADRSIVASDHTPGYISFEESFPLADGWLVAAALAATIQSWRRKPSALVWLTVFGGACVYLTAIDLLYNLGHGTYAKGRGGATEAAINLGTAAIGIGAIRAGWRYRHALLGRSPG